MQNFQDLQDEQSLSAVVRAVSEGKCILFLGAGAHYPPPDNSAYSYPENERPPLGSSLSQALAEITKFARRFPNDSVKDLQRVAQDFETQFQRNELVRRLREAVFTGKQPSPTLRALACLDFPIVITTNYDQLFEKALRAVGKDPFVSVYKKNEERNEVTDDYPYDDEPAPARPLVFKIHGDIIAGPESIVITDEDYIQFVLRMSDKQEYHPVPETILYYFKRWPTLFIGYSLRDYNLRLLFKTLRWKVDRAGFPPAYAVDLYPDPLILDVWHSQRRYINFLVRDIWAFVPELYRRVTGQEMPG